MDNSNTQVLLCKILGVLVLGGVHVLAQFVFNEVAKCVTQLGCKVSTTRSVFICNCLFYSTNTSTMGDRLPNPFQITT